MGSIIQTCLQNSMSEVLNFRTNPFIVHEIVFNTVPLAVSSTSFDPGCGTSSVTHSLDQVIWSESFLKPASTQGTQWLNIQFLSLNDLRNISWLRNAIDLRRWKRNLIFEWCQIGKFRVQNLSSSSPKMASTCKKLCAKQRNFETCRIFYTNFRLYPWGNVCAFCVFVK